MVKPKTTQKKAAAAKVNALIRQKDRAVKAAKNNLRRSGKKKKPSKNASKKKRTKQPTTFQSAVFGISQKARVKARTKTEEQNSDDDGTDSEVDFEPDPDEYEDFGEVSKIEIEEARKLREEKIAKNLDKLQNKKLSPAERKKLEEEIAKLEPTHEQFQKEMKENIDLVRITNAAEWAILARNPTELLYSCIKSSSRDQYESRKNSVVAAGFEWSAAGLYGYFTNGPVAAHVGNKMCEATLSACKLMYSIENNGAEIPRHEERVLRITLRSRKNRCPDFPRIVGAISKEKLMELHALYKARRAKNEITHEEFTELIDASTMLYCCALRIFQLRALTKDSIWFSDKNKKIAWVTVPAKVTSQNRFSEKKVVHPDFIQVAKEIIERRSVGGATLLFPLWARCEEGGSDASRLKFEKLMKSLNQEAANFFKWPAVQSYHGTHNFRHGAAQDAYAEGGVELVMLRTGHLSQNCAFHYARNDWERNNKAMFARLSDSKQVLKISDHLKNIRERVDKIRSSHDLSSIKPPKGNFNNPNAPTLNPGVLDDAEYRACLKHCEEQSAKVAVVKNSRRRKRGEEKEEQPPSELPSEYWTYDPDETTTVWIQEKNGSRTLCRVPAGVDIGHGISRMAAYRKIKEYMDLHPPQTRQQHPLQADTSLMDIRNFY